MVGTRAAAVLAGVGVAIGMTGCGGSASAAADRAEKDAEVIYLDLVRQDIATLADRDDKTLRQIGHLVCDTLVVGDDASWVQVVAYLTEAGLPAGDAGELIGYATGVYCPEKAGVGPV